MEGHGAATPLVTIALLGWVPLGAALFAVLPARRAMLASVMLGWLFLPMAGLQLPGLPDFTKLTATSLAALLGAIVLDGGRFASLRPRWFDVPMVLWCLAPSASSVINGLGAHDALSSVYGQVVQWGIPYLLGRLYITDLPAMRDLAMAVFIGGLVYAPLCLYEVRMSPQLHNIVYGFHQHSWLQVRRLGGWRPTVFMQHGLAVGMWMTATALVGSWLWYAGRQKTLWRVPMTVWLMMLGGTAVVCKSLGALALLFTVGPLMVVSKWLRTTVLLWALAMAPVLYMAVRSTGAWAGEGLVDIAEAVAGYDRAGSLQFRMQNEDYLVAHAMQSPILGWGGWGRNRPPHMGDEAVTDGLWVVVLGKYGLVGLVLWTLVMMLPVWLTLLRYPVRTWRDPWVAAPVVVAVMLLLFMIDCLLNAMLNPVFTVAVGGALNVASLPRPRPAARRAWAGAAGSASAPAVRSWPDGASAAGTQEPAR